MTLFPGDVYKRQGYIMLGVIGGSEMGMTALVYYVLVYLAANLGVFAAVSYTHLT